MEESITDRMHHEIEIMTRRLELEKRRLKRLEKELEAARKTQAAKVAIARKLRETPKILARPNSGGSGAAAARCLSARRSVQQGSTDDVDDEEGREVDTLHMKQLVARMETKTKHLDGMKHENLNLKLEVDQIRKHKKQLGVIFERLKTHIKHRADQLADFVEETVTSKEVAGEAANRLEVMKRQRDHERNSFKSEVMRIRKEMQGYENEKREIEVQLMKSETSDQNKKELIVPEEELSFSESSMMRRIMKTAFLNCIQRRHIKQHQKSIEVFEQAFATIKQSTGISDIEEIVRIFMSLESRNYSLLTYVNHMNRDIEALEGLQRARREAELQHASKEEQSEKDRDLALGEMQKKLQATELAMEDDREGRFHHREVLAQILPQLEQVSKRLEAEGQRLRAASKDADGSEFPSKPLEGIREDTLLVWLQWVESALSRFRDLLLNSEVAKDGLFPSTAGSSVKSLQPKRPGFQQAPPLVKPQDLPAAPFTGDDIGVAAQKRQLAKAGLDDDDSEEEDFSDRPLMLKDIRARAEQAAARKKRREKDKKQTVGQDAEIASSKSFSPREDRSVWSAAEGAPTSPPGSFTQSRRSVGFTTGQPEIQPLPLETLAIREEAGSGAEETPRPEGTRKAEDEEDSSEEDMSPQSTASPTLSRGDAVSAKVSDEADIDTTNPRIRKLMDLTAVSLPEGAVSQGQLTAAFPPGKYKISEPELKVMSSRMGLGLQHLYVLKTQFDIFDEGFGTAAESDVQKDHMTGCIGTSAFQTLLLKLGEDLPDKALEEAIKELDPLPSGQIEFFEFAEWFTGISAS